jgi:hypothetical protein
MILNNPLIRRYRYSLMRPRQLWIYVTIYIAVLALIVFVNYTAYQYQEWFGNQIRFFKGLYYQFLVLQVIVLCILAMINSSSAIKDEVNGKSYDFFRMLPISAGKKAAGILVGKNLVVLLLAGVNFLILIILGMLGRMEGILLGHYFLAVISVAVLTNSLALLSSINPAKAKKKNNIVLFIVLGFIFAPFVISSIGIAIRRINIFENVTEKFYTIELPVLILISLVALYFSCWAIKGILRRFTREDEPLFTRMGAYLFMLGFEFVLFGLFYEHLNEGAQRTNYLYWLISLLTVLLIPIWSLRSFERYLEHSGLIQSKSAGNKNLLSAFLRYSNLLPVLVLFAIWTVGSIVTALMTGQGLLYNLYYIVILFSFYLFLMLLLELYVVYKPVSDKIGLLLSFITIVYLFLPLILSGILDNKEVYLYSLLGFYTRVLFYESAPGISTITRIWLINVVLCIVPIMLIWKRYKHILAARQKM